MRILRGVTRLCLLALLLIIIVMLLFRGAAVWRETAARGDLAPATGHWVMTRSGEMFVQEKGPADGIPVVLFHGTAAWGELWRATIDALASAGYRVIALDLPPFGFSDRPGGYTRQDQAQRVSDVLEQLNSSPAIIVGHSFGAGAATELVMRYPERAKALVLIDAALGVYKAQASAPSLLKPKWVRELLVSLTVTNPLATGSLLKTLIARKEAASPYHVEILQRPLTRQHTTSDIADWLYYFAGSDRNAQSAERTSYSRLALPVAILWGELDTVTPLAQAHDLNALLPQSHLTVVEGVGHIPQIEDPALFNGTLLKTLVLLQADTSPKID